jgi:hypothetical protein
MPGTCSDGGVGVITHLMTTDDGPGTVMTLFATVRYVLDNRKEHSVTMDRLTIIPMPFKDWYLGQMLSHVKNWVS